MTRNRLQTEKRLVDAVHELLTEDGFDQVKINRIAQRANVNKVLIYRYFGGLDGLINAYYEQYNPVVTIPPIDIDRLKGAPIEAFFQACGDHLLAEFRQLRDNPQAQEFLKNDLMAYHPGGRNPMAALREANMRQMVDELSTLIQSEYGRPFAALMTSAMTLLTFMAQDKRTIYGVDLGGEEGWAEIEQTVRHIFTALAQVTKTRIGETVGTSQALPVFDENPA